MGAVVFAARAVNGVTAVCEPHAVMVILFAAISAVPASRANVKEGCDRPIVRIGKTVTGGGNESEAQHITRTGRTSTGNGFGTRRDLRVLTQDLQ